VTSLAYDRICTALDMNGSKSSDRRQHHVMYQCPAHPDNNPSLGVDDRGDKVMVRCYAGCHVDDVVAALGMELSDLFDGELDAFANKGQLVRSYLYEKPNGDPWFYVDRYFPKTFRQRLPGADPVVNLGDREEARRLGLKGRGAIFYHAPRVMRELRKPDADGVVWWLDGEKDVETAERHGLLATCPPGFAKWEPSYADRLKALGAKTIVLVVDQDKEKPNGTLGAGQQAAIVTRAGFRSVGLKVKVVAPCMGKDLTDHFNAGCGVDDFQPEPTVYVRPRGMTATALMEKDFEPVAFAVNKILPAGLTICAGSPKVGKSWLALDMCLAVAAGGPTLSTLQTTQGSALYLAREDTYRRLQSRMGLLLGGELDKVPSGLEVIPADEEWAGGEEGLANLTEWADEVGNPRLVVIDTLQKVEPDMGEDARRGGGAYSGNYTMMARYKNWADEHNCAVLMIHHDRKQQAGEGNGDPFTRISGTRGLTGAADTLWFLEKQRESREGTLHITGRDVAEQALSMMKSGPLWNCLDTPE